MPGVTVGPGMEARRESAGTGRASTTWPPFHDTSYWLIWVPPGRVRSAASTSPCSATAPAGDSLRVLANPEPSARDAGAVNTVRAASTAASTTAAENRDDIRTLLSGRPAWGPLRGHHGGRGPATPKVGPRRLCHSVEPGSPPQVVGDDRRNGDVQGPGRGGQPLLAGQEAAGVGVEH